MNATQISSEFLDSTAAVKSDIPLWTPWESGDLWRDYQKSTERSAGQGMEFERTVRLNRIHINEARFQNPFFLSVEDQSLVFCELPTAIDDIYWAAFEDVAEFTALDRLHLSLLASHVAHCLWTMPRRPAPRVVQRVVQTGIRFAGSVRNEFPKAAAEALSGLYHSYHIEGTERWYDPDQRVDSSALRAVLARFALAGQYAAEAGGIAGQRESFYQISRQSDYLCTGGLLREAVRLNHVARDFHNPGDPFQLQSYLLSTAQLYRRLGDPRSAGQLLRERREILRTLPECLPHWEAGNTFLLNDMLPQWVTDAERLEALQFSTSSAIGYVVGSDNRAGERIALAQLNSRAIDERNILRGSMNKNQARPTHSVGNVSRRKIFDRGISTGLGHEQGQSHHREQLNLTQIDSVRDTSEVEAKIDARHIVSNIAATVRRLTEQLDDVLESNQTAVLNAVGEHLRLSFPEVGRLAKQIEDKGIEKPAASNAPDAIPNPDISTLLTPLLAPADLPTITTAEAARRLGIAGDTVRDYIESGAFGPVIRAGNRYLLSESQVAEFAAKPRIKTGRPKKT